MADRPSALYTMMLEATHFIISLSETGALALVDLLRFSVEVADSFVIAAPQHKDSRSVHTNRFRHRKLVVANIVEMMCVERCADVVPMCRSGCFSSSRLKWGKHSAPVLKIIGVEN